jgi:CheY-like chemotaxis protein
MPEMDGVEATERIRALHGRDPYYKTLPIVALTANAVTGAKEMFLENGFNDFLSKPIDTVRLNTILEKWIPKEKQVRSSIEKSSKAADTDTPAPAAIKIEGLDTTKGISLSGGRADYYFEALAAFYEDGLARVNEIIECIDDGNLRLYTINVHALKGASANIGADKVSKSAYDLEIAGQQGDAAFIEKNNETFITELKGLLNNINNALAQRSASFEKEGDSFDTGQFKSGLIELKAAIANMDAGEMNRTIDNLMKITYAADAGAIVKNISKHILTSEYDEAGMLIEASLQKYS